MRTGDVLYFSPRFRFSDLDVGDTGKFIEALRDRLMGFYLEPESRLLKTGDACAACRHSRFTAGEVRAHAILLVSSLEVPVAQLVRALP